MSIEVISIGSSSSGNSYIIRAGGKVLLLDVGLTAKRIMAALADEGIEPESVDAVLITHEHVDHVKSVRAISRKCTNAVFYASRGTIEHTANFQYVPAERIRAVKAGDLLVIADNCESCNNIRIGVFALSHDASEPVGYTISCGGDKLAIVTDTGIITDEIYDAICDANMLVFEANHDEDLLMFGEYPYPVKVRIKGDHGHLSNRYAGELLSRILDERRTSPGIDPLRIMLAHLSFHNNAPFMARTTIESILQESGYERGIHYTLTIAAKDETTVF